MNFIEELRWRGMVHDMTPGTPEKLAQKVCSAYVGFDPTAPSLHIGNLIPIMLLVQLQRHGHKPIALVGGGTVMVGDPSGRTEERKLLSIDEIRYNQEKIRNQLSHFLDFGTGPTGAEMVNNYDWLSQMNFLEFLRDVGKYLTVNYMLAKDSVQIRLEGGISFTEFSYQLLQAYDFYWLYKNKNCEFQFGGSDQWGNITSGIEMVRRKAGGEGFALTCPLLLRSDGTKFGKSASGDRMWLDAAMTSPYSFYQYWLNASDADAKRYIRFFTTIPAPEIESLELSHDGAPHERLLQKEIARDITSRVHSIEAYRAALEASEILFGSGTFEALQRMSEQDFCEVFRDVPHITVARSELEAGMPIMTLFVEKAGIFTSKGEARRMIQNGGLMVNKKKIASESETVDTTTLLSGRYILLQKGKKNYSVVVAA